MQIIELELNHLNFFCPATGQPIISESEDHTTNAVSLRALWIDEVFDEPAFRDEKFQEDWETYSEKHFDEDEDNLYEVQEEFLKTYPKPNWVTFKITTSGMACGPISSTVWLVIDLDAELPEEKK